MKPIEIPTFDHPDDERLYIPFVLPVKGRKDPLEFSIPRREFQSSEDIKTIQWLLAELDADESKVAELVPAEDPWALEKAAFLLGLKPYVTAAQLKVLQKQPYGVLKFINDRLRELSGITVGEYWASARSSTSTERPSKLTSSTEDGDDGTSGEDSAG